MSNNPQDQKFKKWLDVLQQESWQLELIISGFAIYGLFMVYDPIVLEIYKAQDIDNMYRMFLLQGVMVSWYIITLNLIFHVILRGLWIGAIGLRYVSGEIEYDTLKYSDKFTKHLKKRVGSFDNYVATLEKYCSIVFAVTFLLVFYLLGLFSIVFVLVLIGTWLDQDNVSNLLKGLIAIPAIVFISFGMIFTFIDFLTLGGLKRKKWTTFFYYPFYWVFKYLTLSFLYRPMVYNFLDTKFGKRLSLLLVPLYVGIAILAGTGYSISNYIDKDRSSSKYTAKNVNYEDEMEGEIKLIDDASIPSKVITANNLNVFIVFDDDLEDDVFYVNDSLKPIKDKRGLHWVFDDGRLDERTKGKNIKNYLKTVEEMYTLKIDTVAYDKEFVITTNVKDQSGFETFLDIDDLSKGKHLLIINRKSKHFRRDTIRNISVARIPFWYYPD